MDHTHWAGGWHCRWDAGRDGKYRVIVISVCPTSTDPSNVHGGCPERPTLIDLFHYDLEVVASPAEALKRVCPSLTHFGTEVRLTVGLTVQTSLNYCDKVVTLVIVFVNTSCTIESQEEVV